MTPTDYKTHRLQAGLTQKQLAARLGVSRVTINRREKGHDKISEESALAVQALAAANAGEEAQARNERSCLARLVRSFLCKCWMHDREVIRKASYSRMTASAEGCMGGFVVFCKCKRCGNGLISVGLSHWVNGEVEVEMCDKFLTEAYGDRSYAYGGDPYHGGAKVIRRRGRI